MKNLFEDNKSKKSLFAGIDLLILLDIVLIVYLLFFNSSSDLKNIIIIFDVIICVILLFDFLHKLQGAHQKKAFFKHNVLFLIASIPYELCLPAFFMAFRFLLLFKLFKLSGILERYFANMHRFVENTRLDKILTWIVFTVILFTFAIYFLDPSLDLFDSLWFVVVTLTTVGYGDITPNTLHAKIISILLLILGICVFSILTGAISSYFSDKILNIDTDTEEKLDDLDSQLKDVKEELQQVHAENKKLHKKIDELLKK